MSRITIIYLFFFKRVKITFEIHRYCLLCVALSHVLYENWHDQDQGGFVKDNKKPSSALFDLWSRNYELHTNVNFKYVFDSFRYILKQSVYTQVKTNY